MDKFEQQFEDLDVQTATMEGAMSSTTAMTTPQEDVERLMTEVAEAHGLELDLSTPNAPTVSTSSAEKEQDELSERLAKLRNQDQF